MTRDWTSTHITDQDDKEIEVRVCRAPVPHLWYACFPEWEPGLPMGSGTTEAEAIAMLLVEHMERQQ